MIFIQAAKFTLSQTICSRCLRNGALSLQKVAVSTSKFVGQNLPVDPEPTVDIAEVSYPAPVRDLPLMTSRKLEFPSKFAAKQAWLETLSQTESEKLGMVDLHPEIFAVFPRIDILWYNVYWQRLYKKIDYSKVKTRAEMRGGGRKPWPQKGLGKARHGSIRSPLWHKGGKAHGPRGPKTQFFMLPDSLRILGLQTALTVKYAQDKLHIVDSLDLPNDDPKYLEDLVESRGWGLSVLFIDDTDIISHNMAIAAGAIKPYTVMPTYGLNVYSMLKHETLVLTLDALDTIEHKLLQLVHSQQFRDTKFTRTVRL